VFALHLELSAGYNGIHRGPGFGCFVLGKRAAFYATGCRRTKGEFFARGGEQAMAAQKGPGGGC
jgi:hypothetical protein